MTLPALDREFAGFRSPTEVRVCADAVLDHFDDVPVKTHVLTSAHKRTAECLPEDHCSEVASH